MKTKPMFFAKAKGKSGEIYIYEDIGESWFGGGVTANSFKDALKEVGDVETLEVFINSPGGEVFEGVAIYNQLARVKARKIVHVDALCASIATVIAMAGDEIRMASNALFMIHDPSGGCYGSADDMRRYADLMDQVRDTIVDTYVSRTKNDTADVKKWMNAETWMSANEAKEKGFIDAIDENAAPQDVASSPLLAKYKNTPASLLQRARVSSVQIAAMQKRTFHLSRPAAN